VVRVETVIEISSVSKEQAEETAAKPEVEEETGEVTQKTAVVKESAPVAESAEVQESSSVPTTEAPYEEYLKDAIEPVSTLSDHLEDVHGETPVTRVSESGDVRIAMDTENAHVWNELGNVYFNSGACDDAIAAYGKAIELDRQFAWPYSNLALAYVQKSRFAEAILLYQRSIELFAADKDKAVTWNRLGNVYRRLNDYSNAIAAYQTADDLDPDNASVSLRSHYGLLGNLYMDQKPNYVS
jgi:tetratricopeptide (TPR) repeat protein